MPRQVTGQPRSRGSAARNPRTVTPARRIAFNILWRVEAEGAYAGELLHARLEENLKREDASLATELTLGVLRSQRLLDFLIERQIGRPVGQLDLEVLLALRLGVYQLRFLTRVPARAVVNESVELVKQSRKRSAGALVNAALRRIPRGPAENLLPRELPTAERLGILHSHPTWLVERWLTRFDEARTIALLESSNRPAAPVCAVFDPAQGGQIVRSLEAAGLRVAPGRLLRSALVVRGGSPARTEPFRRGWISIQDEAAQMVPLLLEIGEGQKVLDLCAAPGGKTMFLARAAGRAALVLAADLHEHRLRATQTQLERIKVHNVRLLALDATRPLPFATRFDRILVDAPCSGTGTLARNPEIRWRLRADDLGDLARKQMALVSRAAEHLAPGGRLVYSTCSLESEENEQIVAQLVGEHNELKLVKPEDALAPHLAEGISAAELFDSGGYFRTFPPEQHSEGFFAAVLERG